MCTQSSFSAAERVSLSMGNVWKRFVGRWKQKTQMGPTRFKCGIKRGPGWISRLSCWATGILHWKTNNAVSRKYFANTRKITIPAGNNGKASNNVPIFVFFQHFLNICWEKIGHNLSKATQNAQHSFSSVLFVDELRRKWGAQSRDAADDV